MGSEDFLHFSTFEGLADIICAQDQELRQAKTHLAATTERHREEVTAMSAALDFGPVGVCGTGAQCDCRGQGVAGGAAECPRCAHP